MTANAQIPKELFELRVMADDPRFEGFALESAPSVLGRDSLDDDITPGFGVSDSNRRWSQVRLGDKWNPPRVIGRVAPYNDFPGIDMVLPAFSQRACDALGEFLEPNGELLPLQSSVAEYFFYNVTTIVDALDPDNSQCEFWCDPPTTATSIDYFAFHRDKLAGLSIFRIHEWPMGTIVSDQFVRRVHECGLNGFEFVRIWPYDRGVHWRTQGRLEARQDVAADSLKRNTLVIILPLKAAKPTANEKRVIKRFEDDLDAQLIVPSLDAPFFGWYEGSDTVNAEYRMFLSCPDADNLERKLQPWLRNLNWPVTAHVVKRYGRLHDPDAAEKVVDIV